MKAVLGGQPASIDAMLICEDIGEVIAAKDIGHKDKYHLCESIGGILP